MHYMKHAVWIFAGSMILSACGGGSSGTPSGTPGITGTTTTINNYTVTGTSSATGTSQPINPGVNNGNFNVSWNISSSDPYHVDLYVSSDSTLSTTTDIKFFGQNCGSASSIYNCGKSGTFTCTFGGDNKISCGTISAANPAKDLTSFLDTIPKTAYIVMQACNGLFDSCKTSAIQVEFQ